MQQQTQAGKVKGKKESQDKNRSRKRREATKKNSCRLLKVRELTLIKQKKLKLQNKQKEKL